MHPYWLTFRSTSAPATVAGVGLSAMAPSSRPAVSGRAASEALALRPRSRRPVNSTWIEVPNVHVCTGCGLHGAGCQRADSLIAQHLNSVLHLASKCTQLDVQIAAMHCCAGWWVCQAARSAHLHSADNGGGGAIDGSKQRSARCCRGHACGRDCSLFEVEGRADDIVQTLQPLPAALTIWPQCLSVAKHMRTTVAWALTTKSATRRR
jgi:hypothetical protein